MQEDINASSEATRAPKAKKSNGKWSKEAVGEDLGVETGSHQEMTDGIKGAYDRVMSRGSDMLSNVDVSRATGLVREYPISAAFGGLVIGFLLGAAITHRSSTSREA